jgi:hypothetical protein
MKIRVELTANFERNLDAIEAFWQECGAPHAYDDLLAELLQKVIPNLEQHPRFGRDFLVHTCGSIQVRTRVTRQRARLRRIDPAAEIRSTRRCTLPVVVIGRASMNSMAFGILVGREVLPHMGLQLGFQFGEGFAGPAAAR